MAAAKWSPSRDLAARHIILIVLPMAMRDAPSLSGSYQRRACSTAVATNGTILALKGRPAWMHTVLQDVKALPGRLRCLVTGTRRVDRRLRQLHIRNVAGTIWENSTCRDAHDQ